MPIKPGMSYRDYDALLGMRWTVLKHMLSESPKHFRRLQRLFGEGERTTSDALTIGKAVHAGTLEPETWESEYAIWEGGRRAGKEWENFCALHRGKTLLRESDADRVAATIAAVKTDPFASQYLAMGVKEMVVTWTDPLIGPCKSRNDVVNGHLIDLKTTRSTKPVFFGNDAARLLYVEQLAFYRRGLRANKYRVAPEAILIAAETDGVHDVAVFEVDASVIDAAEERVIEAIKLLKTCIDQDEWPGYAPAPMALVLPKWWYTQGDELELSMGGETFGVE